MFATNEVLLPDSHPSWKIMRQNQRKTKGLQPKVHNFHSPPKSASQTSSVTRDALWNSELKVARKLHRNSTKLSVWKGSSKNLSQLPRIRLSYFCSPSSRFCLTRKWNVWLSAEPANASLATNASVLLQNIQANPNCQEHRALSPLGIESTKLNQVDSDIPSPQKIFNRRA